MINNELITKLFKDYSGELVIICDDIDVKSIKSYISNQKQLINYHIINTNVLYKYVLNYYDDESLYYLLKNGYSLIGARSLIKASFIYLNASTNNITKTHLDSLSKVQSILNDHIIYNNDESILDFFKDKKIIDVSIKTDIIIDLALKKLYSLKERNLDILRYEINCASWSKNVSVYRCNNALEEVRRTIFNIYELLEQGVLLKDIVVVYLDSSYFPLLDMVLKTYKCPYYINEKKELICYDYVTKFIRSLKEKDISKYNSFYNLFIDSLPEDNALPFIKEALLNILNKYIMLETDEINMMLLIDELNKTCVVEPLNIGLQITSSLDNYNNQQYLFVLGSYNTTLPTIVKNIDFFSEDEFPFTNGLPKIQNKQLVASIKGLFSNPKKVICSYSKTLNGYIKVESSLFEELEVIDYKPNLSKIYSLEEAYLEYVNSLDMYRLYGEVSEIFKTYHNLFRNNTNYNTYLKYDNQLDCIDAEILNRALYLSYSKINKYYSCPFSYYISKYWEDEVLINYNILIGNFIHHILERMTKNNITLDDYDEYSKMYAVEYIENSNIKKLSNKLKFYFDFLLKQMKQIYSIQLDFMKDSNYQIEDTEIDYKFDVVLDNDVIANFNGKIDKLLKFNNHYCVIDYKTGNINSKFYKMEYGLNLQLPIYLYMIRRVVPNAFFGGAFYQKVLLKNPLKKDKKSLAEQFIEETSLFGISSDDLKTIGDINAHTFEYIDKKSPQFDEHTFDLIVNYVENKIKECGKKIINGEFKISPYYVDDNDNACMYCDYKNICFKKNKNNRKIEFDKDYAFLGDNKNE